MMRIVNEALGLALELPDVLLERDIDAFLLQRPGGRATARLTLPGAVTPVELDLAAVRWLHEALARQVRLATQVSPAFVLACADCAEKGTPAPRELELAIRWQATNVMPEAGGLQDQRAGEVTRMLDGLRVFRAMKAWATRQPGHEDEWVERHPAEWTVVQRVQKLRGNGNSG